MLTILVLLLSAGVITGGYVLFQDWRLRRRALERLYDDVDPEAVAGIEPSAPERWLGRWLALAGFRRAGATTVFVTITAVCAGAGFVAGQFYRIALMATLVSMVASVPGGTGDLLAAVLGVGHWILLVGLTMVPSLFVRAARRARVRAVEQDLPLVLELFSTMADAGLGFDSALAKVVRAQGAERPLVAELTNFQYDMLAGMPRTQALRQLARRVDVGSLTSFTSALVQAEEVGASVADTLRHQADDLRQRRREDALLKAQALPVKLVFPLVICFLPGIFLSTLAPVIYQMIQVADGVLRSGR